MLASLWFLTMLHDLAASCQPEDERTLGVCDAFEALAHAADDMPSMVGISLEEAIAWMQQQMALIRPKVILAQSTPPERARLAYYQGRVAACSLILLKLRELQHESW